MTERKYLEIKTLNVYRVINFTFLRIKVELKIPVRIKTSGKRVWVEDHIHVSGENR